MFLTLFYKISKPFEGMGYSDFIQGKKVLGCKRPYLMKSLQHTPSHCLLLYYIRFIFTPLDYFIMGKP